MNLGVSIVISTFNGKNRLEQTLEHLSQQQVHCKTELILVDNASTDGTKEFADEWWLHNGCSEISYRSFYQPIPGKSFAQEMGYQKARYEFLLVCDDDNWLNPNYIQTAYEIMLSNDKIGALGGWCEAVFEGEKPKWFDQYARYFAVSKQGKKSGDITDKKGCLYGAGMVLRKSHWLYLKKIGFRPLLTCRKGNTLASGGDTEYCYALRLLGYKMWYDERLYFKHFMPKGRMTLEYVKRLRKAMSEADFTISPYQDRLSQKNSSKGFYRKKVTHHIKNSIFKNTIKRLVGNFEQKEQSKEYFRKLNKLFFAYREYENVCESIDRWLSKHK